MHLQTFERTFKVHTKGQIWDVVMIQVSRLFREPNLNTCQWPVHECFSGFKHSVFCIDQKYFIIPEGSSFVSSPLHPLTSLKRGRERSTCRTEQTSKTYKLRCEKLANLSIYFNFINQQFPLPKPIPQSNLTGNPLQNGF